MSMIGHNNPFVSINALSNDDKKKVKNVIYALNDSLTRVAAERELQKQAIEEVFDELGIDKKIVRRMAKVYYKANYNTELEMGNEVRRGFEIGYVGSTGRSTGPHLHFELRKDGVYVDPYSSKIQLDLWNMRDSDSGLLTRDILLLGTPILSE
jgi:septal ring factor EnvC (AmiA/AmiB activator)